MEQGYTTLNDNGAIKPPGLHDKVAKGLSFLLFGCLALAYCFNEGQIPAKLQQSDDHSLQLAAAQPSFFKILYLVGFIFFAVFLLALKRHDFTNLWTPAQWTDPDANCGDYVSPTPTAIILWVLQLLLEVSGVAMFLLAMFNVFPSTAASTATEVGSLLIILSLVLTIIKCLLNIKHWMAERLKNFEVGCHRAQDHNVKWRIANSRLLLQWQTLQKMVSTIGALCLFLGYSGFTLPSALSSKVSVIGVGHFLFVSAFFFGSLNLGLATNRNPAYGNDNYGTEMELSNDSVFDSIYYTIKRCWPGDDDRYCIGPGWMAEKLLFHIVVGLYMGSVLIALGGKSVGTTTGDVGLTSYLIAWVIPGVHAIIAYPRSAEARSGQGMSIFVVAPLLLLMTAVVFLLAAGGIAALAFCLGLKPWEIPVVPAGGYILLSILIPACFFFHKFGSPMGATYNYSYIRLYENLVLIGATLCVIAAETK